MPEAKQNFEELREQGRLPGCVKGDHGQMSIGCPLWDEHGHLLHKETTFPLKVWAYDYATNRAVWVTNVYEAVKESRASSWQLVGAWRLDERGKYVELK
jgi:hypothetical protein